MQLLGIFLAIKVIVWSSEIYIVWIIVFPYLLTQNARENLNNF